MVERPGTVTGGCPPHHWVIATSTGDQGTVERWSCQRCDASRERVISRRRSRLLGPKRYVGAVGDAPIEMIAQTGERVA